MFNLSKRGSRNKLQFLDYFCFFGALILVFNLIGWAFACYGFDAGYELGHKSNAGAEMLFSVSGPRTYEGLYAEYLLFSMIGIVTLLVYFLRLQIRPISSKLFYSLFAVNLCALFCLLYRFISIANPSPTESSDSVYNSLFRSSLFFDRIWIFGILALLLMEIAQLVFFKRNEKTKIERAFV